MNGSVSATPQPPSPSISEPPPSYDSLNHPPAPLANTYPPPSHFPTVSIHHQALDAVSPPLRGEEEIQTVTPPPPYFLRRLSFGLSRASRNLQRQEDGESVPTSLSLIEKIQEAHKHSTNSLAFLRELGDILLSTIGCMILLIVFFVFVPLTILVFGVMLVDDCPLQSNIPIFLIVGGLSVMMKTIFLIVQSIILRHYTPHSTSSSHSGQKMNIVLSVFNTVFNLFLLAWTIAGSYWVYSNYRKVIESRYLTCSAFLYKFTFTVITSSYILLLFLCCACSFIGTCFGISKRSGALHSVDNEGTSGSDWIIARSDVIGACSSLQDVRQRTNEEEGVVERDAPYRDDCGVGNGVTRIGEVPMSLPPVGLASITSSTGQVDNVIFNMQAAYSPTLPVDSEAADVRRSLANLPMRVPTQAADVRRSLANLPMRVPTLTVEDTCTSCGTCCATCCARRQATTTMARLQPSYSNSSNLDFLTFRGWNLGAGTNSRTFQNTTASYISLIPIANTQHMRASEYARSNPILYDPNQQSSQRNSTNKRQNMASRDHSSVHSSLGSCHHHGSRTNLRGAKSSSILYATVQQDGYSTTHV